MYLIEISKFRLEKEKHASKLESDGLKMQLEEANKSKVNNF